MPSFAFLLGVFCLVVGTGYLVSSRLVEWTLNHDRTGQRWARLLGRDNAAVAMRYIFSLILIGIGAACLFLALGSD